METTRLFNETPSPVVERHRAEYRGGNRSAEPDGAAIDRAIEAAEAWLAGAAWRDVELLEDALGLAGSVPCGFIRKAFGASHERSSDFWDGVRVAIEMHAEEVTGLSAADRRWP